MSFRIGSSLNSITDAALAAQASIRPPDATQAFSFHVRGDEAYGKGTIAGAWGKLMLSWLRICTFTDIVSYFPTAMASVFVESFGHERS